MPATATPSGAFTTSTAVTYDSLHRPVSHTTTLPTDALLGDLSGTSYTTTTSYDAIGQAVDLTLPAMGGLAAETASTGYRLSGTAETLTLAYGTGTVITTPVITGTTYDGTGKLVARSYGNDATRTYGWDTTTQALTRLTTSVADPFDASSSLAVQDEILTRDVMGRVVSQASTVATDDGAAADGTYQAECYTYDGFNRLAAAWTVTDATTPTCGSAAPAGVTATGWDPSTTAYAQAWTYSAGGQIASVVNGAGADPVTSSYIYGDSDHVGAVTEVVSTDSAGTTTDTYTYDAAGRLTARVVDGEATTFTWDVSSNMVATGGDGGDLVYLYDTAGQRVAQVTLADGQAAGTATAYVASGEVTDPDTSTAVTGDTVATRYYMFAGAAVALRDDTGDLFLMFGDEQGSTSVMMPTHLDASGAMLPASQADIDAAVRTAYTPYGQLRGADNTTTSRGWLGQVEDGTGLTYLNARYYDPTLMRFLSPDPLVNPRDPRTLDAYVYGANNPVQFTDPSGLCAMAATVCIDGYAGTKSAAEQVAIAVARAGAKATTPVGTAPVGPAILKPYVDTGSSSSASSKRVTAPPVDMLFNQALSSGAGATADWTFQVAAQASRSAGSMLTGLNAPPASLTKVVTTSITKSGAPMLSTAYVFRGQGVEHAATSALLETGARVAGRVFIGLDAGIAWKQSYDAGESGAVQASRVGVAIAAGAMGMAAGAAVGSIVPIAGTAVGAVAGFAVGAGTSLLVSWLGNLAVDRVAY